MITEYLCDSRNPAYLRLGKDGEPLIHSPNSIEFDRSPYKVVDGDNCAILTAGSIANEAISAAHLSDFIDSLPDGLETDLGKRKDELSGGQLQRIGLARALYSRPKLLVMDEATSALDAESEDRINMALDEVRGKVTVILVAHRLNTIQRSNIVFLVENGRVVASGTFQELLKSNKTVQNLAALMAIDSEN